METVVSIFANFFIDNEERLQRLKDSYASMSSLHNLNWIVNIRGGFRREAAAVLKSNKNIAIYHLNSIDGWFYDTANLFRQVRSKYVLLWIEDHICMRPEKVVPVVEEMNSADADVLTYTFWQGGKMQRRYGGIPKKNGGEIDVFEHTSANNGVIQKNEGGSYLVSYASIIKSDLVRKILIEKKSDTLWPKETPFNFEITPGDEKWLPLKRAVPQYELFAVIDDDHGSDSDSLISRNLYPNRQERQSYAIPRSESRIMRVSKRLLTPLRKTWSYRKAVQNLAVLSHHRVGYLKSLIFENYCLNSGVAWINYKAQEFLIDYVKPGMKVFEYVIGGSTFFFLANNCALHTVEHNAEYYEKMLARLKGNKGNFLHDLKLPEVSEPQIEHDPSDPDLCHSSDYPGYTFTAYRDVILSYPDSTFDLVMIDGRARTSCLKAAIKKVKPGGIIVLDNSDRSYYTENLLNHLSGFRAAIFRGPTPGLLHWETTTIYEKTLN